MAFTDAQKKDIRKYLGVPFGFYHLTTRLESMMLLVGDNATDSTQVIDWLTELAVIDERLNIDETSAAYASGSLKRIEDIEFYGLTESGGSVGRVGFQERGKMLILRIARALGVDDVLPNGDYFKANQRASGMLNLG